jgi:membrane protein
MSILRTIARRLWATVQGFSEHEGMLSAAAVAYYVALAFFPLLLVLVAGLSWVLQWTDFGRAAQQELLMAIQQQASPQLAEQVERILRVVGERAGTGGPIGFAMLVVSALVIFAQLDAALDRIFKTQGDVQGGWLRYASSLLFQRLKALAMLVGLGGFVLLVMISSMILSAVLQYADIGEQINPWIEWITSLWTNLLLDMLVFTLIYRSVPKVYIRWREAAQGGIVAAILWEVGRQGLSLYLLRANYQDAYGVIGSFLVVMLWAYYGALVILFGAEYVRVLRQERMES